MTTAHVSIKTIAGTGKTAVYGIGDNYNFTRCSVGYNDGWDTTRHTEITKNGMGWE